VDQQQVDVVGAQALERFRELARHAVGVESLVGELGGQQDIAAGDAGSGQPAADRVLVAVGGRGVDVTVAELERVAHGLGAVVAPQHGGPQAELRDRDALDGEVLLGGQLAWHRHLGSRPAACQTAACAGFEPSSLAAMRDAFRAPFKAAATAALLVGLTLLLVNPPSLSGAEELLSLVAGAIMLVVLTAWATVALMGEGPTEAEFERTVRRSEALARRPPAPEAPSAFDELVVAAIDDLPDEFQRMLEDAPVVVSHRGREHRAYGHYIGDTVARETYPDRIVIYRDTLERDFGHDPELLRAQVQRTLRHEVAHHLGWDEQGVRGLGL